MIYKDGPKTKNVNWILNSKLKIRDSRCKKRYGIVTRKVTKIVSTNYVQDQETIKQTAIEFLNNEKQIMQSFDESNTFNSVWFYLHTYFKSHTF